MFDRVLNMPQVLNKPEFLICLGSQYARVLNIQEFWICQDSAYASGSQHGSEYTRILNMPMFLTKYTISTQGPEYAWIFPGNVWIGLMCLNVHESAWICLNGFCFTCPHCNLMSTWMHVTHFNKSLSSEGT